MSIKSIKTFIDGMWDHSVLPVLMNYIAVPAVSPAFDKTWESRGYLKTALTLAKKWVDAQNLDNTVTRIIAPHGKTPVLVIEAAASGPDAGSPTLIYGHLDKQPPADGWDKDKGPWQPVIDGNRLYGRGSADDGYSVFMAVTAIKALQESGLPHPKCIVLVETCEESGSLDLPYYLETLDPEIGSPGLVICLDSACGDWERIWITTSLRGIVVGRLTATVLNQPVHSGISGMVPDSFRIIRELMDRIEDTATGRIKIPGLTPPIPENRLSQIREVAPLLDRYLADSLSLAADTRPMSQDPVELIINSTWKPMLSTIGAAGIPPMEAAANVIRKSTELLLSLRIPPHINARSAAGTMKAILEKDPPNGAGVLFDGIVYSDGWDMPPLGDPLEQALNRASDLAFQRPPLYSGEGGSIPFMSLLAEKFPRAKFLITGVLGPKSNAHGPNEFLDIPYAKKLTLALSYMLSRRTKE